jgi:predicted O-methyltransferase YrrM
VIPALSDGARRYVSARYSRPEWAKGSISREDAAFLYDAIIEQRPQSVAEIGIGAGVSTTFLSTLLSDRLPESRLYSFDNLRHVFDDPSKAVGAFLFEVFGRVPQNLSFGPGVASSGIRFFNGRPERFDFVFLDANHNHPWPCLDLLSILDLVQPGAWIVLHDISLPLLGREWSCFGPLYLFRSWPGEKVAAAGSNGNIGAIRLFDDSAESALALMRALRIPWPANVPRAEWRSALEAVAFDDACAEELRAIVERPRIARGGTLKDCEIVVKGANPWSRFASDLVSESLVLHANLPGQPRASIVVRGLHTSRCQGVVFPNIVRAGDAPCPLRVRLTLATGQTDEGAVEITMDDSESRWTPLLVPESFDGRFDIEIAVEMSDTCTTLHGAWVRFDAIHFV